ncbi:hypothetical protein [uncultured Cyclobacterium sp.]|uniref:hypothetical protein n=1 Tax=uncultured Cyclobacterium sp. TaxID=453820 RepID=UPI0030EE29B8|tara:strand:- start:1840 stop:2313 length:474 start_codon:yes stop_codon:yes gene_type:complete
MKIIPYFSVGDFNLKDNIQSILSRYPNSKEGSINVLGKKNKTLYLPTYDIHIVFSDIGGNEIESIEIFKGEIFFNELNILNSTCLELKEIISNEDKELIVDNEGFTSPKFGFGVYCKSLGKKSKPTSVIVFNSRYLRNDIPSPDDIIKYYLGNKSEQ